MDARTFQQHAARVAELTDTLLAERAANKAARTLNLQGTASDAHTSPASASTSTLTNPQATPSPSPSPDKVLCGDEFQSHHSPLQRASVTDRTGQGVADAVGDEEQQDGTGSELTQSAYKGHIAGLGQSGHASLSRDGVHPTSATAGGGRTEQGVLPGIDSLAGSLGQGLPAGEGLAGSLGGSRGSHYCTICNVSTTSAVHLQTHYMGSKHQRRLAQAHNGRDRDNSPHYCDVCGISATSAVHLQLHLNGRAHQRKAKLASESSGDYHADHPSPAALAHTADSGTM